jgi:hypothetical protein
LAKIQKLLNKNINAKYANDNLNSEIQKDDNLLNVTGCPIAPNVTIAWKFINIEIISKDCDVKNVAINIMSITSPMKF